GSSIDQHYCYSMHGSKPSTRMPYSRLQCYQSRILRGSHRQAQQLTDHSGTTCNSSYPEDYLLRTGHRNRTLVLCAFPCVSKDRKYEQRNSKDALDCLICSLERTVCI